MSRTTRWVLLAALVLVAASLWGCAPGSERYVAEEAGFWSGLWHGLILIITFIISLFTDNVGIYESHNTGNWYDFGFVLGAFIAYGGLRGTRHARRKRIRRLREKEWEEIGSRIEEKVRRGIRRWLEEEEKSDDEWEEIARKIEDKIKRELRDWADR